MSASDPNPGAYKNTEVTVTINNSGSSTASNVKVEFPKPPQTVYTGGNEWTATKGTFEPFDDEKWTVGNLPAGVSESITVSYFTLSDAGVTAYAQVSSANGSDSDSTPGNGTCCTSNEDDEAAVGINGGSGGGGSCTISASVANMTCDDRGTPNDPSDDRFNVQFNVQANGTECGNQYKLDGEPAIGTFGAVGSFYGFYPIADGPRTFTIRDNDDSQYFTTITVTPPAPCSNGGGGGGNGIDLELSLSQPNASPDQWSNYTVNATINNTGLSLIHI